MLLEKKEGLYYTNNHEVNILEIIIVIGILFVVLVFGALLFSNKTELSVMQELDSLSQHFDKMEKVHEIYDYVIEINHIKYYCKELKIVQSAVFQINSQDTFVLKYGGKSAYSYMPYTQEIKNIREFQLLKTIDTEQKLLILDKTPLRIIKYINECELIEVLPHTDCFGMNIISKKQIKEYFNITSEVNE